MTHKTIQRALLPLWLLAAAGCAPTPQISADRVLSNGHIYTVNEQAPWAEAVAIKDQRIIYVGDSAGAAGFIGATTQHSDLGGRFVIPGIIDGHTHPGMMEMERYGPSLPKTGHKNLLAAVKDYAAAEPGKGWLKLCCWPNAEYIGEGKSGPHKRDLDAVVADRPVWITSATWHSYWLNSKALETLGVNSQTPDPAPGVSVFARDPQGELTGWLKEGAGWQFMAEHFPPDIKAMRKGIDRSLAALSSQGVTTLYDGGNWDYEDEVYSYLSELDKADKLPLRYEGTYVVYLPERRHIAVREMRRLQTAYGGKRLKFRTIKLFMDGITPEMASGVSQDYVGYPEQKGNTTLSVEQLRDWLLQLHQERFDLHVHVIGDLAVRKVLDGVEAAKAIIGESFYPRVTLAHLQMIDKAEWPRFAQLGVSANFTPWWHGLRKNDISYTLLGDKRSSHLYPANELIKAGANVTFSSDDWGVEVLNPFLGMEVAHKRQFPKPWIGKDTAKFQLPTSEQIELEQMIRGYTLRGAYPLRMENDIGSIEVGKLADLLVLDNNILTMDIDSIHKIKPSAVIMEGQVIHGELVPAQ